MWTRPDSNREALEGELLKMSGTQLHPETSTFRGISHDFSPAFLNQSPKKTGCGLALRKTSKVKTLHAKKGTSSLDVGCGGQNPSPGIKTRRYSTTDSSWLSQSLCVEVRPNQTLLAFGRLATLRLLNGSTNWHFVNPFCLVNVGYMPIISPWFPIYIYIDGHSNPIYTLAI